MKARKRTPLTVENLESRLSETYQAVKPGHHLMNKIKSRIKLAPPTIVAQRMTNPNQFLLIIGSVVSGMILIITIARAFYYLSGGKNHSA